MVNGARENFSRDLGAAIAQMRGRAELTQEELAVQIGVGNEAVSRIERGASLPSVERLLAIADVFDCSLAELLGNASARPSDQAGRIARSMASLSEDDQAIVVDLAMRLAHQLRSKEASKTKR